MVHNPGIDWLHCLWSGGSCQPREEEDDHCSVKCDAIGLLFPSVAPSLHVLVGFKAWLGDRGLAWGLGFLL